MTHDATTYRLVDGTGLMVHHFDEPLRLAPGAPVSRSQPDQLLRVA
jgi:hypothetical protein